MSKNNILWEYQGNALIVSTLRSTLGRHQVVASKNIIRQNFKQRKIPLVLFFRSYRIKIEILLSVKPKVMSHQKSHQFFHQISLP